VLVGAGEGGGQSSVQGESGDRKLVQDGVWSWSGTGERDENRTYLPGKESLQKILRLL
jgi:hypothetical protein